MMSLFYKSLLLFILILSTSCTPKKNSQTLADARSKFTTYVTYTSKSSIAPLPPATIFQSVKYDSAVGALAAYITPEPNDSIKHPAIIWITGGDSNTIDNVWSPSSPDNDQTASAYRNAGIVMMFPSLRGGNDNPGKHEAFYGEVDDILAAFNFLSKQSYVDPDRIYLGGHSTGGTLALLTAEFHNPFRAVFSFGPSAMINNYGKNIIPVDFSLFKDEETKLRSPVFWLESVQGHVYVIEGEDMPSNIESFKAMKRNTKNTAIKFVSVSSKDHFSVLSPINEKIATAILKDDVSNKSFDMTVQDFWK